MVLLAPNPLYHFSRLHEPSLLTSVTGVIGAENVAPGDVILVNGPIGDHGAAILSSRGELGLESDILSDSAPLNGLVERILEATPRIHCMRGATRGGLRGRPGGNRRALGLPHRPQRGHPRTGS